MDAVDTDGGSPALRARGAVLAGALTGFALGTKMTALLQAGLLGLGLLYAAARSAERGASVRSLAGFAAAAALVGCPWYVKSWLWTGNPVYPFLFHLFPHSYSWTAEMARAYTHEQRSFGRGSDPIALVRVLWDLAVHGRDYYVAPAGQRTVVADRLGSVGAAWIGLLPLALYARGLGWRVHACLAYGAASLLPWFFLSQQSRYLAPVFAVPAVALAVLLARLPRRALRLGAGLFTALCLLLGAVIHGPIAALSLAYLAGGVSQSVYLRRALPALYPAAEFINTLPLESRIALFQETRGYYFDRKYFWANPGQHDLIPYDRLEDGRALAAELARFGMTHVYLDQSLCDFGGQPPPRWYRLVTDGIRRGVLEEVFRSPGAIPELRGVFVFRLR